MSLYFSLNHIYANYSNLREEKNKLVVFFFILKTTAVNQNARKMYLLHYNESHYIFPTLLSWRCYIMPEPCPKQSENNRNVLYTRLLEHVTSYTGAFQNKFPIIQFNCRDHSCSPHKAQMNQSVKLPIGHCRELHCQSLTLKSVLPQENS